MMRIIIDGIGIEYDIRGGGAPVLLLHGWGASSDSFLPVINFLQSFRTVAAIDFPGHGKSDEPPQPWSVTEYCECTAKLIEELGIAPCDIVAHSFGGRVAIMLAAKRPELVKRLVLCGSAGILPRRSMLYHVKVRVYKIGKAMAKCRTLRKLFCLEERMKNAGSEDYRALSETMKPTFVRVVNQNLRPYLEKIQVPALLIWGREDCETPLYMGEIMEKSIKDSALIIFEGAGHYAYLDDFPRFSAIISSFFGGTGLA